MKQKQLWLWLILIVLLVACSSEEQESTPAAEQNVGNGVTENAAADSTTTRPAGWNETSHSNEVDPNYDVVFPDDKVNEITITIAPENWEAMQADMTELMGEPGTGGQGGPGGFGGPPTGDFPPDFQPPEGFEPGQNFQPPVGAAGAPGFGGGDFTTENPMWVPATIAFEGSTWTNVGVRYKGNSSLNSAWSSGSNKLPFKLDFDEFESDYPEIENQRFYGFKQLSLSNGFGDATYMRDAITYDLLEEAGLVSAATAFYNVTLDYGEGPVNLGLYVVIEVIDDTVIESTFGDDSGNIYEGDGAAASLAEGTFAQIADSFQKENNAAAADWSDIEALYNVLHSETRTSDAAAWRAELEAIFDVDSFLEWLGLSAVLLHWDTYGAMSHNYYLYHDPETDLLTWISWDHNLVLGGMGGPEGGSNRGGQGGQGRQPGGGGPGNRNTSFDRAEVNEAWPLIRFLLDDPVYYERYISHLTDIGTWFDPEAMATQYQTWATLLEPYAAATNDTTTFTTAIQSLTNLTYERAAALNDFLNTQ